MYPITRAVLTVAFCATLAHAQKQYKPGEYEAYNAVVKDVVANNFAQALADLDTWSRQFPQSDYAPDREVLYVKTFVGGKQWAKAVDKTGELMAKGIDAFFPDPKDALQVLYNATIAIPMVAGPSPAEVAAGDAAARALLTFDRRPAGLSDPDWSKLRADIAAPAKAALLYLAMLPGNQAMTRQPRDCVAAEAAYRRALEQFPESSTVAYNLATALHCSKKTAEAIYEYERAATVDPTLGGTREAAQIRSIADNAYIKFHGSDEGLAVLKEMAGRSPLPPPGFTLKTTADIEAEHEAALEAQNPQLALWKKIRGALSGPGGDQYFETQLKNAAVPQLRGSLVTARPACRPKELVVSAGDGPEILLQLDRPLAGKPEPGAEFRWEGVPSAFAARPFLLTMDTEAKAIQGLAMTPCGAPVRKK